jgi:Spy/CpxP family protein refolding chaperone
VADGREAPRFTNLYRWRNLGTRRLVTSLAKPRIGRRSNEMSKSIAIAAPAARRVQVVLIGMAMTLLAAISVSAWAQPAPPSAERGPGMAFPGRPEMGDMHRGMGRMHEGMHGMHGGMGGMGGGMMFRGSPERMSRMIDHMLDGLNASDAQRNQIKQIAAAAAADMRTQREAGRGLRQRALQAFTAPTVDAAAAEQVRQQMLQQHDQTSRRMTQAMLDVARVLTPEQRARLGERIRDRQARMEDRMKRMESMRGAPPRR